MKKTKRDQEQIWSWVGLGAPIEVGQMEPYTYYDMSERPATTITIAKWGYATRFSYELIEYARAYGHIKDLMGESGKDMGKAHAYLRDQRVARFFNRIATDTAYDSVAFAGTHTLADGSSLDNALTAASFNYDNFWSMRDHFSSSVKNHSGQYIFPKAKWLIANQILQKKIDKVVKNTTGKEPDTADNNMDTLKDFEITPIYSPLITSTTSYTLLAEEFKDDFYFFTVEEPSYHVQDDFQVDAVQKKSRQRFGLGCRSFFNLVYNPGA